MENLTGGTPPVRYLPCVVPCKLYFTLVQNKGIVLSREQLLRKVWGNDFLGDDRTVDTHIKMLRSALGPYRGFIVTMRGAGYKFEAV